MKKERLKTIGKVTPAVLLLLVLIFVPADKRAEAMKIVNAITTVVTTVTGDLADESE